MKKPVLIGAFAGAVLILAAGGAAFAADGSPTSSFSFVGDLASRLGISQATLQSAIQKTELDKVGYLEQSGRITASQAQKLESAINSGRPVFGLGLRLHRKMPFGIGRWVIRQMATDLGLAPRQLVTDLRGGQTLAAVIAAQGKSTSTIEADLEATLKSKLDQAVANGRLTTTREQEILSKFPTGFQKMLTRTWPAHPRGMATPAPSPGSSQG